MVSIGTINGENSDIKYDLLAYYWLLIADCWLLITDCWLSVPDPLWLMNASSEEIPVALFWPRIWRIERISDFLHQKICAKGMEDLGQNCRERTEVLQRAADGFSVISDSSLQILLNGCLSAWGKKDWYWNKWCAGKENSEKIWRSEDVCLTLQQKIL